MTTITGITPTVTHQHLPVVYTATCDQPGCGADATWTARYSNKGRKFSQGVFGPTHHVDCPDCGPCPCCTDNT